jgi:hypothetical protein
MVSAESFSQRLECANREDDRLGKTSPSGSTRSDVSPRVKTLVYVPLPLRGGFHRPRKARELGVAA